MTVDLDDLTDFDPELAESVQTNARTYTKLISDIVFELLPTYKTRDVSIIAC
jgi:hypothetical protein